MCVTAVKNVFQRWLSLKSIIKVISPLTLQCTGSLCLLEDLVHDHTKYFHFCWQGDEFACALCDQKGSFFYPSLGTLAAAVAVTSSSSALQFLLQCHLPCTASAGSTPKAWGCILSGTMLQGKFCPLRKPPRQYWLCSCYWGGRDGVGAWLLLCGTTSSSCHPQPSQHLSCQLHLHSSTHNMLKSLNQLKLLPASTSSRS